MKTHTYKPRAHFEMDTIFGENMTLSIRFRFRVNECDNFLQIITEPILRFLHTL